MTFRGDCEHAFWLHWRKGLNDSANVRDALPGFLDELERINREQVPEGIQPARELTDEEAAELRAKVIELTKPQPAIPPEPRPSDAELTAWIEAHPREFEAWARKQERINGAPPLAAPAKTAPRRRTPR